MCPKDVSKVMQAKFLATVIVFGVTPLEGDIMLPYFFPKGLRVNTDEYLKILKEHTLPWIQKVATGRPNVGKQNSAPYHTSRKS